MRKKGGWRPSPPFLPFLFLLLLSALLALGITTAGDSGRNGQQLVISSVSGRGKLTFPVMEGEAFTIRYIHSVDNLPVYEDFRVGSGEFVLLQTRQHAFGAGLGDWQGDLKYEDGLQVIKNINKNFTILYLRIGLVANQTLIIGKTETPLSRAFKGGELVLLYVDGR